MVSDVTLSFGRRFFRKKAVAIALSWVLTIGLGLVNYATGNEIARSAFYWIPICWAGWAAGRKAGMLLAGASAAIWLIADAMTGYTYPNRAVPYWNALMLLVLFVVVVLLLSAFERAHRHLEEIVDDRTAALRTEIAERKRLEIGKLQSERLAVVGTMAGELPHEVRNPLGTIALNLDLISKEIDSLSATSRHAPGESRLLVNEMRDEVRRIQRVIEDYLQFARFPKSQRSLWN